MIVQVKRTLFKDIPPERLIAGIVAGLALWIDAGDWACGFEGFGTYAGGFVGVLADLMLNEIALVRDVT